MRKVGLRWDHNVSGLNESDNALYIRNLTGVKADDPDTDPITAGIGDAALASIARFHTLRRLIESPCIAISSLAAGIVGAARLLSPHLVWVPQIGGGDFRPLHSSWASAVVKVAGAHTTMLCNRGDELDQLERGIYRFVWCCAMDWRDSAISDDAYVNRNDIKLLRERGVLVRPKPSEWAKLCQCFALLGPNSFVGEPVCKMAWRQHNGKVKSTPLAPARTLAVLGYAADHFRRVAGLALKEQSVLRSIRCAADELNNERRRYAMWASGMSPNLSLQMQMFDCAVVRMYDAMIPSHREGLAASPYGLLYGQPQDTQLSALDSQHCTVEWSLPPWAKDCPGVPAVKRGGVFND